MYIDSNYPIFLINIAPSTKGSDQDYISNKIKICL